eukprot:scpid42662/ scgid17685/ 
MPLSCTAIWHEFSAKSILFYLAVGWGIAYSGFDTQQQQQRQTHVNNDGSESSQKNPVYGGISQAVTSARPQPHNALPVNCITPLTHTASIIFLILTTQGFA